MTTKHITVWHRTDDGQMTDYNIKDGTWERAYSYDTDRIGLEQIWRDNNRVDGSRFEEVSRHGTRSLCIGDVVSVDGQLNRVRDIGWFADIETFTEEV